MCWELVRETLGSAKGVWAFAALYGNRAIAAESHRGPVSWVSFKARRDGRRAERTRRRKGQFHVCGQIAHFSLFLRA